MHITFLLLFVSQVKAVPRFGSGAVRRRLEDHGAVRVLVCRYMTALARALAHDRDLEHPLLAGLEPVLCVLHVHRVAERQVGRDPVAHEAARYAALHGALVDLHHALQRARVVEEAADNSAQRGSGMFRLDRHAAECAARDHGSQFVFGVVEAIVRRSLAPRVARPEQQHERVCAQTC